MRGERNKRHNRKITRPCPVCGGRVIVANHGDDWWVACDADHSHIPQVRFCEPIDAIRAWNNECRRTNGDKVRAMSDEELADFITDDMCGLICGDPLACEGQCKQKMLDWLKEKEAGK